MSSTVHGYVQLTTNGGFTYTPNPGYIGYDSFSYRLYKSGGTYSNVATVSLNVQVPPPTVRLELLDGNAAEGSAETGIVRLWRTGSTNNGLSVNFSKSGTATFGQFGASDYYFSSPNSLTGNVVTIPPGSNSLDLVLSAGTDGQYEGPETAVITLTSGTGYALGTPTSATVNIADADSPTTV